MNTSSIEIKALPLGQMYYKIIAITISTCVLAVVYWQQVGVEKPFDPTNPFASISSTWRMPTRIEYYDIEGTTIEEIVNAVKVSGLLDDDGVRRDACVKWRISWEWPTGKDGSPIFENTETKTTIDVIFPKLISYQYLKDDTKKWWEEKSVAMALHENKHLQHVYKLAPQIESKIAEAARRNPKLTEKSTNSLGHRVLWQIRRLDTEYDEVTKHGFLEGAYITSTQHTHSPSQPLFE